MVKRRLDLTDLVVILGLPALKLERPRDPATRPYFNLKVKLNLETAETALKHEAVDLRWRCSRARTRLGLRGRWRMLRRPEREVGCAVKKDVGRTATHTPAASSYYCRPGQLPSASATRHSTTAVVVRDASLCCSCRHEEQHWCVSWLG